MAQARGLCDLASQSVDFWPAAAADILAYGVDDRALLAVDAAATDTYVRRSSIAGAGRGLFAARAVLEGELLLPFYGQVVYHDLDAAAYEADRTEEDKRPGIFRTLSFTSVRSPSSRMLSSCRLTISCSG
ncbi:hypothetical protein I4F81_008717 [Pyropia yezoensis]|uniref:Uncharacterized protein n=1 Tax=Pyropia yezoensis TaxID=2788 RepID=A0ACC3C7P3_PYRYE|nr:hypothetical protein I4F81_008717 [Neopyropia yezoensis]